MLGTPRPTDGGISSTPTFRFSAAEPRSTFECSLTPATETIQRAYESCVSPLTYDAQANGRYTFHVRATDPASNVGAPAPYTWRIGATASPSAPVIGTATAGSASATVAWAAPASDGGSTITGYEVRAYDVGTGVVVGAVRAAAATDRSLTVTGLTNGTAYNFKVRAANAVGTSTPSGRSATVTPTEPVTAPSAPTGVSAVRGNGSATVSWTAPANAATSNITGYRIRRYAGTTATLQATTTVAATARTTSIASLLNGSSYSFDVTAVSGTTFGAISTRTSVVTPATTPGAPAIRPAAAGAAGGAVTATANWVAPTVTGGSPITGYRVVALRVTSAGGAPAATTTSALLPATARTLSMTLPVAGSYQFQVRAVNALGVGTLSGRSGMVAGR